MKAIYRDLETRYTNKERVGVNADTLFDNSSRRDQSLIALSLC